MDGRMEPNPFAWMTGNKQLGATMSTACALHPPFIQLIQQGIKQKRLYMCIYMYIYLIFEYITHTQYVPCLFDVYDLKAFSDCCFFLKHR